jgi:hypothetical protein
MAIRCYSSTIEWWEGGEEKKNAIRCIVALAQTWSPNEIF